ncbi:MAG: helix-turn-helix domain-containing protein [Chlamydiae bacterium]|nr:helix-turn-helix domain-containing protein [Chlamydiota bacterium]
MSEELKRIGNAFRSKRKEMNLSLKEIENSTSIRAGYLEAIEEGSIYQYISSVYAMGFMKQYASFIGLDIDTIIKENPHAFRIPQEKVEFAYGIGTLEHRGSMGGGVKWFPNLLWAVGSAVVLIIAYYIAKYLGVF